MHFTGAAYDGFCRDGLNGVMAAQSLNVYLQGKKLIVTIDLSDNGHQRRRCFFSIHNFDWVIVLPWL